MLSFKYLKRYDKIMEVKNVLSKRTGSDPNSYLVILVATSIVSEQPPRWGVRLTEAFWKILDRRPSPSA